jgi:hypothetical protein
MKSSINRIIIASPNPLPPHASPPRTRGSSSLANPSSVLSGRASSSASTRCPQAPSDRRAGSLPASSLWSFACLLTLRQAKNAFRSPMRHVTLPRCPRPFAARRCHAKLAVWLIELWSKRRASRLTSLARAGATLSFAAASLCCSVSLALRCASASAAAFALRSSMRHVTLPRPA